MDHVLQLRTATPRDRDGIHELRHRVYAEELGQHPVDPSGRLSDGLDGNSVRLVAALGDLLESMVKRGARAKDAGRWLPGSGGLLDRIGSLLVALAVLLVLK
ncbi:hypothetical protein GCM10010275_70370 [Streptomyces litmocidini]|uniref:phosphatidate cytidylyltransferase n=1 Tax=Streptomyces litmocidini TaxID=67318 RepID=UPI001991E051|nr:phosphatidate cytidylyltransferase [Streptomyces litmocidini]GGV18644.1 hypothetical protein GCM10010275_70370 [Streptomyces litmocidini]